MKRCEAHLAETGQKVSGGWDGVVWISKPGEVASLYQIQLQDTHKVAAGNKTRKRLYL